jgi:hypothetical protein
MDAAISQISIDSIMMMEVDAAFDVRRSTGPTVHPGPSMHPEQAIYSRMYP